MPDVILGLVPRIYGVKAFYTLQMLGTGPSMTAEVSAAIPVSLRLSPDVVEYFKATGPGWQSRIDNALRKIAGL